MKNQTLKYAAFPAHAPAPKSSQKPPEVARKKDKPYFLLLHSRFLDVFHASKGRLHEVEGKWAVAGGVRHVCHGHVERRPVWIKCRSLDMPATVLPDCSAMQHPFGSAAKSVPNSNLLFVHPTCDSAASFQVALCHKDGNRGLPDVCGNESKNKRQQSRGLRPRPTRSLWLLELLTCDQILTGSQDNASNTDHDPDPFQMVRKTVIDYIWRK